MQPEPFSFQISLKNPQTRARCGTLNTPHGKIETPAFIFCATKAAMKGLTPQHMRESQTQIILANTYHLMLQPSAETVAAQGGLHQFMGWEGPMLTDSGGFQIFSLGHGSVANEIKGKRVTHRPNTLLAISEEGATFKSYLDGSIHLLTPERSIQIQRQLGADLIVVLDECTPFHVDKDYTARSLSLSHRWALRSLAEFERIDRDPRQALYGIVQGGIYEDLRREGADFVKSQPFFGQAVGGSLGATREQMADVVEMTLAYLDPARPTHLLGIGGIEDIFQGVRAGIDTFDCVHPTRLARHGGALVRPEHACSKPTLNLFNAKHRMDSQPIEPDCPCYTCRTFSRSYLHHLFKARELVAYTLLSLHNVCFMNRLFQEIRQGIMDLDAVEKRWRLV